MNHCFLLGIGKQNKIKHSAIQDLLVEGRHTESRSRASVPSSAAWGRCYLDQFRKIMGNENMKQKWRKKSGLVFVTCTGHNNKG